MLNNKQMKYLETKYGFNLLDDVFFASDKRVSMLFDLNKKPIEGHVISGNVTAIAMPHFETIEANKLLKFVEPNNLLAEVEGKHLFVDSIRKKFINLKDELYLFIPVKRKTEPLWLYAGFKRKVINDHHFVLGQVLRIFEDTPEEIIHYQKTYQDPLTKLFTRETLKKHISYIKNTKGKYLLYLDIDGFKQINDHLGHKEGDQFLVDIANKFISVWESDVLYYRLGGDEFCVYCLDHDNQSIEARAIKLINDIENLNEISKRFNISVSVGIVKITKENLDYHNLLNLGDKTMYISKYKGKGIYTFKDQ